jgi:hypothetical protein
MARPIDVLAACRKALVPDGTLIVVDEKVAPRFTTRATVTPMAQPSIR